MNQKQWLHLEGMGTAAKVWLGLLGAVLGAAFSLGTAYKGTSDQIAQQQEQLARLAKRNSQIDEHINDLFLEVTMARTDIAWIRATLGRQAVPARTINRRGKAWLMSE